MKTTVTTEHTPGPWRVVPSTNPKNGTNWRDIVSTGGEFSPAYVGEAQEADARLMAAAPELLRFARMVMTQATGDLSAEAFRCYVANQANVVVQHAIGGAK